ncbi:TonB family protein [Thermodesulfobacteriota bacterium]
MLLAIFMALALHVGLINFEFAPESISIPHVALPRSVSVLLKHSTIKQTPDRQIEKTEDVSLVKKEHQDTAVKPAFPELQKTSAAEISEPASSLPLPSKLKEISQTKPEDTVPAFQNSESTAERINPETSEPLTAQDLPIQAQADTNAPTLPGTIQLAYPRYQLNAPPSYPGIARKRGQEGTVILQVLVNSEGRVDDLKIESSSNYSLLDRAALTAVRKWTFEPGRKGGLQIPMWVRVPVSFKLRE